jgi:hypothetical protein
LKKYKWKCILGNSLVSEFNIERTDRDAKSLEYRKGEGYIHVEVVLSDSAEQHVNPILIILIYQLEILL